MSNTKKITTAAATFGAALTSLYAAPELRADITEISFSPNTVPFNNDPNADVSQVDFSSVGGAIAAFFKYNTVGGKALIGDAGLEFAFGNFGDEVRGSTFVGASSLEIGAASDGLRFIGFRTDEDPTANVGWFSVDLGGTGGADNFIEGEYGSMGEDVTIGGTAVPEPASGAIAMLALGAFGLRRNRKK